MGRVRVEAEKRGVTTADLARAAGLGRHYTSVLVSGSRGHEPGVAKAIRLAEAVGLEVVLAPLGSAYIVAGADGEPADPEAVAALLESHGLRAVRP